MPSRNSKPTAIEGVPDALGDHGRAALVLDMLRAIQAQRVKLDLEIAANAMSDEGRPQSADGRTVAEQRRFLADAERRVMDEYADAMPLVRQLADARGVLGER